MTVLEQKLGDAHGLALAAIDATRKVDALIGDVELRGRLRAMRKEAEETRDRCVLIASAEMLAHANTIHHRAGDLAGAWFNAGTDALSAWSFLAMGEAAEVTTWAAVTELALQAKDSAVADLAAWALPVQQEHLATALAGAVRLAGHEQALGPRFG
ncbi:MAG TPA: hypothetical protein VGU02_12275 [Gaiellaceae bacterium]|nr:hypothetical protein [Gaiellaceae bacterium]